MDILLDLFLALLVIPVIALVLRRLSEMMPARRALRIPDPKEVVVFASHSGTKDAGVYEMPMTGVGQIQAWGDLAPFFTKAYPKRKRPPVFLSSSFRGEHRAKSLILLGGPSRNEASRWFLAEYADALPVTQQLCRGGDSIIWTEADGLRREYVGPAEISEERRHVAHEFGLIIRLQTGSDRACILFSGTHTYGTAAAARFFVSHRWKWFLTPRGGFVALVETDVAPDGQIYSLRLAQPIVKLRRSRQTRKGLSRVPVSTDSESGGEDP